MSQKYRQFDGAVCQKLRNLVIALAKAKAKRERAFEERDGLIAEIASINVDEVKKIEERKAEAFDAEREIERLNKSCKWYTQTMLDVVEKADEPGLFDDDVDAKVPKEVFGNGPTAKAEKPAEPKGGGGGGGGGKDPRPVGRPVLALPSSVEVGDDQHLDASVKELVAVSPSILAKLTDAKIVKVGQLAAAADAGKDLCDIAGLTEKQAENLLKSLAAFRREHRRAGLEVSRGGRN
jgi:hypothetical protein